MAFEIRVTFAPDPQWGALAQAAVAPILASLSRLETSMSALSDTIARLKTSADAAQTRITGDLAMMRQQIADLQAKVDAGGATAADLADLEALRTQLDALDPTNPTTLPAAPAATTT